MYLARVPRPLPLILPLHHRIIVPTRMLQRRVRDIHPLALRPHMRHGRQVGLALDRLSQRLNAVVCPHAHGQHLIKLATVASLPQHVGPPFPL